MKDSTYKLLVTVLSLVILVGGSMILYRYLQDVAVPAPSQTSQEGTNLAPDFTVTDPEGNPVSLSDFLGQPVVVNFWASWCGPCKSEMPHFQDAWEEYGDRVTFLMVNLSEGFGDTQAKAEELLADAGYTFPVYYDTEASAAYTYGITGVPVTLFVDSRGYLSSAKNGMISEADLQRRIIAILD